jgi:hypothetical protein
LARDERSGGDRCGIAPPRARAVAHRARDASNAPLALKAARVQTGALSDRCDGVQLITGRMGMAVHGVQVRVP